MSGGGFRISAYANTGDVSRALLAISQDQLPFATAVALTECAKLGRDAARESLGKSFTIRSDRTAKGFSFTRAEKKDWPNASAQVGHKDEFLIPHIDGGVKRAKEQGQNVAVPTRFTAKRRGSSGAVVRELKPDTLLKTMKRRGGARYGVFKIPDDRIGRKLEAEESVTGKVESLTLWLLRREVTIKPRWPFRRLMEDSLDKYYEREFAKALFKAIETAK